MNILMIEDNESVSEMMQMFFLNEGWEAAFKYDGKEGLEAFAAEPDKWDMITLEPSFHGWHDGGARNSQNLQYSTYYYVDGP